jgi:hypothetical protein
MSTGKGWVNNFPKMGYASLCRVAIAGEETWVQLCFLLRFKKTQNTAYRDKYGNEHDENIG